MPVTLGTRTPLPYVSQNENSSKVSKNIRFGMDPGTAATAASSGALMAGLGVIGVCTLLYSLIFGKRDTKQ